MEAQPCRCRSPAVRVDPVPARLDAGLSKPEGASLEESRRSSRRITRTATAGHLAGCCRLSRAWRRHEEEFLARRVRRRTGTQSRSGGTATQTAARSTTRSRNRDNEGIIPILARAVREVESAAQRGRLKPAARVKFQAVALLAREARAAVRADTSMTEARRSSEIKRLDGIGTILAKTAALDTSLLGLLAEDAVVTDAVPVAEARHADRRRRRAGARGGARRDGGRRRGLARSRAQRRPAVGGLPAAREPVPHSVVRRTAEEGAAPSARGLGAARTTLQVLRVRRSAVVDGAARADRDAHGQRQRPDAAPGAGGRCGEAGPPHLPARRRARPRQDRTGAARRAGGERLPPALSWCRAWSRPTGRARSDCGRRSGAPPSSTATARTSTRSPTS